jgi:hypothetical protein
MSIIRTGLLLAVVVMLLPAEQKKQAELTQAASRTAEQTMTFCERNPNTCATGRDLWSLFLRKAEYAVELGAGLVRDQLMRGAAPDAPAARHAGTAGAGATHSPQLEPVSASAQPQRRSAQQAEQPPRWR